ncbi:MAG TPA: porin family protein [Flavisolibacter sp.]|nr:porin family protein [Flavisolibacter sp.]
MKRIVLTASVLSALILTATARKTTVSMTKNDTRPSVGIHAGVNMFNINGKNAAGTELNNKLNTGFSGGLDIAVPLGSGFYLQPGVDFTQKGTETEGGIKTTLNYIDIPVTFVYKPIVGTGNMVLGFGPYLGYGLGGKVTNANGTSTKVVYRDEFDRQVPGTTTQLRKSDAGANFLAGYEFANKLSLNLKAQLGLKDINPDMGNEGTNNMTRFRNTGFGISVGYRF